MGLFKRKKKQALMLRLTCGQDVLFDGRADAYPFEEQVITALALEFYNDPEPCEIRRAAVRSRIWMEMEPLVPFDGQRERLPQAQQAYFLENSTITLWRSDT